MCKQYFLVAWQLGASILSVFMPLEAAAVSHPLLYKLLVEGSAALVVASWFLKGW